MEKPAIIDQSKSPAGDTRGAAAIGFAVYAGVIWSAAVAVNYALAVNLGAGVNAGAGFNVWKAVNIAK